MFGQGNSAASFERFTTVPAQPACPPPQIPNYKLLDLLGEGGIGTAYRAEQTRPIQRTVVIKVIKPAMDAKIVIARFEAQREALALMNHPNVASTYDAGTTDDGRPFFVTEFVDGVPIGEYCDRHKFGTDERLRLFVDVCDAVQHAHQKGILHRAIKPGNILVERRDSTSTPKVVEFGVANAIDLCLTTATDLARQSQFVNTTAYLSPELAGTAGRDIDTRTDIYSLGVVLYELLTGALPFDAKRLKQASVGEIQRIVLQEVPPRPSSRLGRIEHGTDAATIGRHRNTDLASLARRLRGDLDGIAMKVLEKDRTRRYVSASALAEDIVRHLKHEPVVAGPSDKACRVRKFVRRHRILLASGTAVAVTLVAVLAGTTWQSRRTKRRLDIARRELHNAELVQDSLIDLFNVSELGIASGKTLTVGEMLDHGCERIRRQLADRPVDQATMLQTVGGLYRALGFYDKSLSLAKQALNIRKQVYGNEHVDVAAGLINVANVLEDQGEYAQAAETHRRALAMRRKLLGDEHRSVADSLNGLANDLFELRQFAEAERLHREALALRRRLFGDEHPDVAESVSNLAGTLRAQDHEAEADRLYREALAIRRRLLGDEHPDVAASIKNLAVMVTDHERYAEAIKLYRERLKIERKLYGDKHPNVADSLYDLATVLAYRGRYAEAESLHRQALAMQRTFFGEEDSRIYLSLAGLGMVRFYEREYSDAERLVRDALALARKLYGEEHPRVARSLYNVGITLYGQGRYAEAEDLLRQALAMQTKLLDSAHLDRINSLNDLAMSLFKQGKYQEAHSFAREATRYPTGKRPNFLDTLALTLHGTGDIDAAVATQRQALALMSWRPWPLRITIVSNLAMFLTEQGNYQEAERLLLELYDLIRNRSNIRAEQKLQLLERIIRLYDNWHAAEPDRGYDAKAEPWQAKRTKLEKRIEDSD